MATVQLFGPINQDTKQTLSIALDYPHVSDPGNELRVQISSLGGQAYEAIACYHLLRAWVAEHSTRLVTVGLGLVESAATLILCAGDEVQLAQGTILMLHAPRVSAEVPEDQRAHAEWLVAESLRGMTEIYSAACERRGKQFDPLLLANGDHYLTAEDAVALGLADSVIGWDHGGTDEGDEPDDSVVDANNLPLRVAASATRSLMWFARTSLGTAERYDMASKQATDAVAPVAESLTPGPTVTAGTAETAGLSQLIAALGATDLASAVTAASGLTQLKAEYQAKASELAEARAELRAISEAKELAERAALVESLVASGKVLAARAASLQSQSLDTLRWMSDNLLPSLPSNVQAQATGELSPETVAWCAAHGVRVEDFVANMKRCGG